MQFKSGKMQLKTTKALWAISFIDLRSMTCVNRIFDVRGCVGILLDSDSLKIDQNVKYAELYHFLRNVFVLLRAIRLG